MNSNTTGYCLTLTIKDLVATLMVLGNRTKVAIRDVYELYHELYYEMKQQKINGLILYSSEYFKEFQREYKDEFNVGEKYISLKPGYDINWIQKHIMSYISIDKLELLGFIPKEDKFSF